MPAVRPSRNMDLPGIRAIVVKGRPESGKLHPLNRIWMPKKSIIIYILSAWKSDKIVEATKV